MDYDTTNANLANVMRGESMQIDPAKTHDCPMCHKEYPCGPAFCEGKVRGCFQPKEKICGGCFMRALYD